MKKLIIFVTACALLLSLVLPAMASAVSGVVVVQPGGTPPVVKCKWEQQPAAVNPNLEDGDSPHSVVGFDLLPPGVACAKKMIEYYAVVTDDSDGGDVAQVFADVYHPVGSPEPYGKSKLGGILMLPYWKYEVPFVNLQPTPVTGDPVQIEKEKAAAQALIDVAAAKKLIIFNTDFDLAEVKLEIEKGVAKLWKGEALIDYEQPAGAYDVYDFAIDKKDALSAPLKNQFRYIAVATIEWDFETIDWGTVSLGVEKMVIGDTIWNKAAPPRVNGATVRNVGNCWASVKVNFDDMDFGQDLNGKWNVNFDARMGNDQTYYVGNIMPLTWVTLPNALRLSCKDELDLSIKVIKGAGSHNGPILLGAVYVPFADPVPANIVGFPSPKEDCP